MMSRIWIILFLAFAIYSAFVYVNSTGSMNMEPDEHIMAGWKVWQDKNCQSCHQLYGLGGYMGPDLTNVISDTNKSAAYARGILKHGTSKMPDLYLSDTEIDHLIDFLTWVDKSGRNRIPDSSTHWTGTYIIAN